MKDFIAKLKAAPVGEWQLFGKWLEANQDATPAAALEMAQEIFRAVHRVMAHKEASADYVESSTLVQEARKHFNLPL